MTEQLIYYPSGKPIPTGSLVFTLVNGEVMNYPFKSMTHDKSYRYGDIGVTVFGSSLRVFYPYSSIIELLTMYNTDEYTQALQKYQEHHEHNWHHIEDGPMERYGRMLCVDVEPDDHTGCNLMRYLTQRELEEFEKVISMRTELEFGSGTGAQPFS